MYYGQKKVLDTIDASQRRSFVMGAFEQPFVSLQEAAAGPPPAYDAVVRMPSEDKNDGSLQEVVTEACQHCTDAARAARADAGLPSYEAAVLLRDTKL
ncbi:hypothetical protein EVAR_59980_1 [Eumeta japonica]|uniref:Uncharacterized protein n=1 Tax=Eumeta variegata TaxID=151549 RepID=A0A4C2AB32_EUMVA|nr:hypothetical protein EVAR_59980_1 [Eumeta japonica]